MPPGSTTPTALPNEGSCVLDLPLASQQPSTAWGSDTMADMLRALGIRGIPGKWRHWMGASWRAGRV